MACYKYFFFSKIKKIILSDTQYNASICFGKNWVMQALCG